MCFLKKMLGGLDVEENALDCAANKMTPSPKTGVRLSTGNNMLTIFSMAT